MKTDMTLFEDYQIRRIYDEDEEPKSDKLPEDTR